ncbi:hypothetical protein JY475_00320 [Stenotrophomonas maltophilia]|nr:hypothetical protein [Stenotrophomonas maltophilia]MBH1613813.1 hypothetical protein [Stenotrophomonas maltophilia]MBN5166250.1 hypothetical protein [Stenotrophomonas maltophilia]
MSIAELSGKFKAIIERDNGIAQREMQAASRMINSGELTRDEVHSRDNLVERYVWLIHQSRNILSAWANSGDMQPVLNQDAGIIGMVDPRHGNIVAFTMRHSELAEIEIDVPGNGKYAVIAYEDLSVCLYETYEDYRAKWNAEYGGISSEAEDVPSTPEELISKLSEFKRLLRGLEDEDDGNHVVSFMERMKASGDSYKRPNTMTEARAQAGSIFKDSTDPMLGAVVKGIYQSRHVDIDPNDLRRCAIAAICAGRDLLYKQNGRELDESNPFSNVKASISPEGIIHSFAVNNHVVFFGDEPMEEDDRLAFDLDYIPLSIHYIDARTRSVQEITHEGEQATKKRQDFPSLLDLINNIGHEQLDVVANNLAVIDGIANEQLPQALELALSVAKIRFQGAQLDTINAYIRVRYAMRLSGERDWSVAPSGRVVAGTKTAIILNCDDGVGHICSGDDLCIPSIDQIFFVGKDSVSRFLRS